MVNVVYNVGRIMKDFPATLRVGIECFLFAAFISVSQAGIIWDNSSDTTGGSITPNSGLAQTFTMPSYSGDLSQLKLNLDFNTAGSVKVYLDTTTSGAPTTGTGTSLGRLPRRPQEIKSSL
jgi:hypothetical protein